MVSHDEGPAGHALPRLEEAHRREEYGKDVDTQHHLIWRRRDEEGRGGGGGKGGGRAVGKDWRGRGREKMELMRRTMRLTNGKNKFMYYYYYYYYYYRYYCYYYPEQCAT